MAYHFVDYWLWQFADNAEMEGMLVRPIIPREPVPAPPNAAYPYPIAESAGAMAVWVTPVLALDSVRCLETLIPVREGDDWTLHVRAYEQYPRGFGIGVRVHILSL